MDVSGSAASPVLKNERRLNMITVRELGIGSDASTREKIKRYRLTHCLVSCGRRMQVIATVENGKQLVWMLWVAHHCIEIDHRVEMPRRANPLVHCLAVRLTQRAGMIVV